MSIPATFAEKRRSVRARRLRRAVCVYNNGASTYDVTVRDISPSGAKIAGHGLAFLPKAFELRILEEAGAGYAARPARIVWVRNDAAGVTFTD